MNEPRVRFRTGRTEVLTVDYTTVLHQAVENERLRVLREVRRAAERTATTEYRNGSYSKTDLSAESFKTAIIAALDGMESNDTEAGDPS